jgi:hypothetical protein
MAVAPTGDAPVLASQRKALEKRFAELAERAAQMTADGHLIERDAVIAEINEILDLHREIGPA